MRMATVWMVLVVFGLSAGTARAAEGGWSFEVLPYLWAVGIDADVKVGGTKVDVSADASDLIRYLDFGASLLAKVQKDRWANRLQVDYFELSDDKDVDKIDGAKVEVDSDSLFLTVATGIQLDNLPEWVSLELLGGLRYAHMKNKLKISGLGSNENNQDIFDGVFVLWPSFRFSKHWGFNLPLSVGAGDSDLTFDLQPQFQFNFTDTWKAILGYRYLYYDTEGSRGNSFKGAFQGFMLGFGAAF
jgi:outer membrane receptor protein involved in Fe transport